MVTSFCCSIYSSPCIVNSGYLLKHHLTDMALHGSRCQVPNLLQALNIRLHIRTSFQNVHPRYIRYGLVARISRFQTSFESQAPGRPGFNSPFRSDPGVTSFCTVIEKPSFFLNLSNHPFIPRHLGRNESLESLYQ